MKNRRGVQSADNTLVLDEREGDVPGGLAAIDAELDAQLGVIEDEPFANARESGLDQASRLRRLMGEPIVCEVEPARVALATVGLTTDRHARIQKAKNAKIIAIASGKGGVGKTNLSVNLAIALAQRNLKVTLLDADLGTANADVVCGVFPSARLDHVIAPSGLAHSDAGKRTLRDISVMAPGGFTLVPGSAGLARLADLNSTERRWLISGLVDLASDADVLIVDAAAGVGSSVTGFLHAADLCIVVATPEPTAIADAYSLLKCATMGGSQGISGVSPVHAASGGCPGGQEAARWSLVVNEAQSPLEAFSTHARISNCAKRFLGIDVPMLGFIAQDVRVSEAIRAQRPLLLRTPDAQASRDILGISGGISQILGLQGAADVRTRPSRGLGELVRRLLGMESGER